MSIILTLFSFFTSPLGRWVAVAGVSALAIFGSYTKGRFDGRAAYKQKIERQINEAIKAGNQGRVDSLRDLDSGMSNDWFRD